jgi:hypothetical protein
VYSTPFRVVSVNFNPVIFKYGTLYSVYLDNTSKKFFIVYNNQRYNLNAELFNSFLTDDLTNEFINTKFVIEGLVLAQGEFDSVDDLQISIPSNFDTTYTWNDSTIANVLDYSTLYNCLIDITPIPVPAPLPAEQPLPTENICSQCSSSSCSCATSIVKGAIESGIKTGMETAASIFSGGSIEPAPIPAPIPQPAAQEEEALECNPVRSVKIVYTTPYEVHSVNFNPVLFKYGTKYPVYYDIKDNMLVHFNPTSAMEPATIPFTDMKATLIPVK